MPPLEYDREEPQTLPLVEAEARTPDDEYKDMPPLEGDVLEDTASAAVSPLQSDLADTPVLPCPERPEEIVFTTETPEGPPSPCDVLPAEQGVTFPVFPRGRDLRDRRPPTLLPLILQIFQRIDGLCEAVDFHQRMLRYSRRDLISLGAYVRELAELSGLDMTGRDLVRQRDGDL